MLSKILVAIDESASSEWAFDTALDMAKALKAELLLVHVLDAFASDSPKHPQVLVGSFLSDVESPVQKEYEQRWQQFENRYGTLLRQKRVEAEAAGVAANHIQVQGMPERKICDIAKNHNIDLIVAGSRDRTSHSSISNYLVRHAPCSVTVVHPKSEDQVGSDTVRSQAVAV
ncbi:universal stress protein [cf. Phormidesmis sp. LEGE 11477]|uniref:universal stress protein n=1 Tax=cf. Phormidesmis sp. LEGE 11477 TaxID=1828680 RepID=UPI0018816532|nr:universal stress protein [cf. Phormidesmis sp. LEGE 11477]MBE9062167.1 universal stress protein [cf. Phormidesmis sp. LEGE 11477]